MQLPTRIELRRVALMAVAATLVCATAHAEEPRARGLAVRAGWAYGLGLELEYRPRTWGLGVSGGHVPGLGSGGYFGVQWGMRPLDRPGLVAEAGVFRGVHNPLRVAETGLGVYALVGYALLPSRRLSLRVVGGGGVPLGDSMHPVSFEILAKLTLGVVF